MDALVIHAANDLRIEDIDTPEVQPDQLRVQVRFGGICGSDLHYYNHGGFGTVRVKEPMVLGHEVAGRVEEIGPGVHRHAKGDRVAISPSRLSSAASCSAVRSCGSFWRKRWRSAELHLRQSAAAGIAPLDA